MEHYLVFDAGGTFVKYALMDENAIILEKGKVKTPEYETHTKEDFYLLLDKIVENYQEQISGIAISMPGMLNSRTGYCRTAGYLNYLSETNVAEELKERYGCFVSIENDGKCAALAEYWQGSLKGCKNSAVVVLGSGVAGGLILNGKLYTGSHYTAGEYSYVCTNGKTENSLEAFWGISGGAQGLAKCVAAHTGEKWESYDGIQIFQRANTGDKEVLRGLKDYTDALAVQIYNINILLDLDCIAIGGGISQQPLLLEYLEVSLKTYLEKHPIRTICPYVPEPKIVNCKFYNDANLIGALYHYKEMKGE